MRNRIFLRNNPLWAILFIALITTVVYANSLSHYFAGDDNKIIVGNHFIKSWKNLSLLFSPAYLTSLDELLHYGRYDMGSGELSYRPVVTFTYFLDYAAWKLKPFGYHLSNLILHIVNALLFYLFITLITGNRKISFLASLFFAIHPVNSETVCAIAFREDMLAFMFLVSSFILYIKSDASFGKRKARLLIASVLLYFLALFSKEMAATMPIFLIAYDYYFVRAKRARFFFRRLRSRYIFYILATLLFAWIWSVPMHNTQSFVRDYPGGNFYTSILTMCKIFGTYIKWLFLPNTIHVTFGRYLHVASSFFEPRVLFSISALISSFIIMAKTYKNYRFISFGILWFFIALTPVANIIPIADIIAVRYLYIPSAGFCIAMSAFLAILGDARIFSVSERTRKVIARDSAILILIFYGLFTAIYNLRWRHPITLWQEVVERYPHNPGAHCNLGLGYLNVGESDKAIEELKIAVELCPQFARAHSNLGAAYAAKGQLEEVIYHSQQAIIFDPRHIKAYRNLARAYAKKKDYKKALLPLKRLVEVVPNSVDAYVDLSFYYGYLGRYEESIYCCKKAIELNPLCAEAYTNLGVNYANLKRFAEAENAWKKALDIDPGNREVQHNIGMLRLLEEESQPSFLYRLPRR